MKRTAALILLLAALAVFASCTDPDMRTDGGKDNTPAQTSPAPDSPGAATDGTPGALTPDSPATAG